MILQGFTCSSAVMLPGIITRLKKKSQSVDISGPGCNPVAAEAPALQPSKPLLATKTTSEEEQKNTANTQKRNPRRSELKRYYTIDNIDKISRP
ncbi:oxidation resistance protein 1-like isoform X2 [Meleagris gallopavo]|uniref:oxidation resistance protein 1-like isoform X2 n=1 Tax=Meleagris gallopavo TaxID=9103 RepID=UPI000549BB64|nr:oxidation resistance protein 1-like isoform X2 [Meleagris gallopavo]